MGACRQCVYIDVLMMMLLLFVFVSRVSFPFIAQEVVSRKNDSVPTFASDVDAAV